jgi:hypothetical protein
MMLGLLLVLFFVSPSPAHADTDARTVHVYKTSTCACCTKWVEHLQRNGFVVVVTELDDLQQVKRDHQVPDELSACHTATTDGYVIEGHVPAEDIRQLLRERPEAAGIAVTGMPEGSPGMEGPNPEPYAVMLFGRGGIRVFSRYGGEDE